MSKAIILKFESKTEMILRRICDALTKGFDYGLCSDNNYFSVMEEYTRVMEKKL